MLLFLRVPTHCLLCNSSHLLLLLPKMADNSDEWTTVTKKQHVPKKPKPKDDYPPRKPTPSMFSPLRNVGQTNQGLAKGYVSNKNTSTQNLAAVERKIDEGTYDLPTVSHDLKLQLQKARAAKGWTQEQLAKACNLPTATVRGYENGSTAPVSDEIVRMSRALGVVLKNTK